MRSGPSRRECASVAATGSSGGGAQKTPPTGSFGSTLLPDPADRRPVRGTGRGDVVETRPGFETGGPPGAGRIGHDAERGATWDRITALAGLLFVLLVVAGFFTPDTPDFDSSPEQLAGALTDERT